MIDYKKLPLAPPHELREEMVEVFMNSDDYEDDEVCDALIKNIRNGFMVVIGDNKVCITKEGFNYVRSLDKTLN